MTLSHPLHPIAYEAGLIRQILCGRRDLFGDLIEPHLKPLSRVIQSAMGPHPDVEDIVQQVSLKAFVCLGQFRGEASFKTWLVRIGLNEVRQWRRRSRNTRLVPLDVAPARFAMADHRCSPSEECQRNQLAEKLHWAAERLPVKYRAIFQLDLQEVSAGETARRLGMNVATVKTRRLRARRRIASILNRQSTRKPATCIR